MARMAVMVTMVGLAKGVRLTGQLTMTGKPPGSWQNVFSRIFLFFLISVLTFVGLAMNMAMLLTLVGRLLRRRVLGGSLRELVSPITVSLPTGTVNGKFWIPGECDVSIRPHWFYRASDDGRVRTPKNLVNLYFASVGRGASFLLNLAPDKRGQLHPNDRYSLETYGKVIREMFSKNFAAGSRASASVTRKAGAGENFSAEQVLDGNSGTYWATPDGTKRASLTLELKQAAAFDVIRLREPIRLGQRIRKFHVEVRVGGEWKMWQPNGSSVGAHVLLRGKPVTADAVRVSITDAAACPLLSEVSSLEAARPYPRYAGLLL